MRRGRGRALDSRLFARARLSLEPRHEGLDNCEAEIAPWQALTL